MTPILHITHKARYLKAHADNFALQYPMAFKDHGLPGVVIPDTRKSNGLTQFVINFITWSGGYANRINTMGRLLPGKEKQESGVVLTVKKFIRSSTMKGTADIHAVLLGRHISIEIKIGQDRMSGAQCKERIRIESAGGIYIMVKNTGDFFDWYDKFVSSNPKQTTLL